jgi:hypothetical protein
MQKSRVETSPAHTSFGSRPGLQVLSLTSASRVAPVGQPARTSSRRRSALVIANFRAQIIVDRRRHRLAALVPNRRPLSVGGSGPYTPAPAIASCSSAPNGCSRWTGRALKERIQAALKAPWTHRRRARHCRPARRPNYPVALSTEAKAPSRRESLVLTLRGPWIRFATFPLSTSAKPHGLTSGHLWAVAANSTNGQGTDRLCPIESQRPRSILLSPRSGLGCSTRGNNCCAGPT